MVEILWGMMIGRVLKIFLLLVMILIMWNKDCLKVLCGKMVIFMFV